MEFKSITEAIVLAIIILPILVATYFWKNNRATFKFSSVSNVKKIPASLKQRLRPGLFVLRVIAVILLLFGFARPREGIEKTKIRTEGIAVQIVFDKSGSMTQVYMPYKNTAGQRIEIAKQVTEEFITGNNTDFEGRPNDQIGLITFASFAEENCPLTLDHANLVQFVKNISSPSAQNTAQTAIGDALRFAVYSLSTAENNDELKDNPLYQIKSKIIILITDGEQTYGEWTPLQGAEIAKKNNIKIYAIAITGKNNFVNERDPFFGDRKRFVPEFNTKDIEEASKVTGGVFYKAGDEESLRKVYESINQLEKSKIENTFTRYREMYWMFILPGFLLLLIEALLSITWLRKLP